MNSKLDQKYFEFGKLRMMKKKILGVGWGMALWGMVGVGSTSVIVNRLMRKAPYFPCK